MHTQVQKNGTALLPPNMLMNHRMAQPYLLLMNHPNQAANSSWAPWTLIVLMVGRQNERFSI